MLAYRLAVLADPLTDGLLRLLGAVAIQPVEIVSVRHDQTPEQAATLIKLVAANRGRVELLAARLALAPWVRDVELVAAADSP